MRLQVYLEHSDAKQPSVAYGISAGVDVYSIEDVTIEPGKSAKVHNGLRFIIPNGYYLTSHTRSSLGFLKDLYVYPGVFDASFAGTYELKIYNLGDTEITIKKGDKYAQFILHKVEMTGLECIDNKTWEKYASNKQRGELV